MLSSKLDVLYQGGFKILLQTYDIRPETSYITCGGTWSTKLMTWMPYGNHHVMRSSFRHVWFGSSLRGHLE